MKSFLFPTDFSPLANSALEYAVQLAELNDSKISLLNTYEVPLVAPGNIFTSREQTMQLTRERFSEAIWKKLDDLVEQYPSPVFSQTHYVKEGNAVNEILKLSRQNEVDLIVMGTKGESGHATPFLGSVTADVLRRATCPVLAIPEAAIFNGVNQITYATDLTHDETHLFQRLVNFAKTYDSSITFLHISPQGQGEVTHEESLQAFMQSSDYGKLAFLKIEAKDTIEGLNHYIDQHNIQLLAMTTRTKSLFEMLFHQSATRKMIFHTHIPLLAFSQEAHSKVFI